MSSPRIRHFMQPSMSVADRNLSITNEVRTIMTTTALPLQTTQQRGLELLVSRAAVGMLRWAHQRTARQHVTHDEMMLLRQTQKDSASATDLARLSRLG
jgi:hypothetical protein